MKERTSVVDDSANGQKLPGSWTSGFAQGAHRSPHSFEGYSRSHILVANLETTEGEIFVDENGAACAAAATASPIAKARLLGALDVCETGSCYVEKGSIYGAAILMPQLARSMNWQRHLAVEAFRSFLFIGISFFLQVALLTMLARQEMVLDAFAGQMFLCDLGAGCMSDDPPGSCAGPAGTTITPERLYSFDTWVTRTFVRESLKAIFPDKQDEIQEKIDPGEYGLESYFCRLLCCILFVMSMLKEAMNIIDMAKVLYYPPTIAESWIEEVNSAGSAVKPQDSDELRGQSSSRDLRKSYEDLTSASAAASVGPDDEDWLKDVNLKIAGMPLMWKVINALLVLLPKMLVWKLTVQTGVVFLMETASISDLVVNSIALTFILSIDEMICETLTSQSTLTMLSSCKDYPLFDVEAMASMTDVDLMDKYGTGSNESVGVSDIVRVLFPPRMLWVLGITAYFVFRYYDAHCQRHGATFLPTPLHLPKSQAFSLLNAFFPDLFPVAVEDGTYWSMPGDGGH